jgi:hypothetical protein
MEQTEARPVPVAVFAAIALMTVAQLFVPAVVVGVLASVQVALGVLFVLHLRDERRRMSILVLFPFALSVVFVVALVFFENWGRG